MNTLPKVYHDNDILIWVGQTYPTIDSYIEEAQRQGCSRRLPGLLRWIEPGKTRVFLAHRDNNQDNAYGSLFGFYTINSLHVIYDDITSGRGPDVSSYQPVLRPHVKPPVNRDEVEEYIVSKKIVLVRQKRKDHVSRRDPFQELVKEWIDDWLKDKFKEVIKHAIDEHGIRHIPWSAEPDNLERLCGGASNMGSGRFPGTYASDEIGDWFLDQILDSLLDEGEPDDDYFWEEIRVKKVTVTQRRKHKRAEPGFSRSGRITLQELQDRYGRPPKDLSGLVIFPQPYPLYHHPPEASFRGIQRIDGDSLLLKVNLPKYILPRTFSSVAPIPQPVIIHRHKI